MIYHYPIANPNCDFLPGFLLAYVGDTVMEDLFAGSGKNYKHTLASIKKELAPRSFALGKRLTLDIRTEHHPEGVGMNVLGIIPGSDSSFSGECIVLGAHLDHLGTNPELMPGANDNASGVAVILGVAQAMANVGAKPKRPILLAFFGAEEQGVKGSEFFLSHPPNIKERIRAFINLDGVGRGESMNVLGAKNFPKLWLPFDRANQQYVHREAEPLFWVNIARQRLDAAHFMWAGIPTISFGIVAETPLPYATYHTTRDRPETITPEIMEDLSRVLFLGVYALANGKDIL